MKRLFILLIIILSVSQICQATLVSIIPKENPLDNWMSPISVSEGFDPYNEWFDINNSIDESISSYATWDPYQSNWRSPLTFNFSTTDCNEIRFYAKETNDATNIQVKLESYYNDSWHTVGTYINLTETPTWYEMSFGVIKENVSAFQLKFNYGGSYNSNCYLYAVEYNAIPEPATIFILGLGILVSISKKK